MCKCDLDRLSEKIKTFSKFGDTGNGGITRLSLSDEALAAREEFCERLKKLGANIVTDDMANIYATIPGSENLPAVQPPQPAWHCLEPRGAAAYGGYLHRQRRAAGVR